MAGKKYTVIIIPDETSGTRRFGVARRTIWVSTLCVLLLFGISVFLVKDRVTLENKISRLEPLHERSVAQRKFLERFGARLNELDGRLSALRKSEDQLRIMASVKPRGLRNDLGLGGVNKDEQDVSFDGLSPSGRRFVTRLNRQFLDLEQRSSSQKSAFEALVNIFKEKKVVLAHTPSILPARGWLTSGFGRRRSPFTNRMQFHSGIDIVSRQGTPIMAPADGLVIKAKREGGYGNILEIRHMQGIVTRYAHNKKNLVRAGMRVKRGSIIAQVGSTGRSTGPHLHYEVRLNGVAVNPMLYIVDTPVARR
ncbi:MAG: M23 family metallopeptidase [Nitrospinota bacterium]|nr:M23 family metallopeptidase [Nitrospinota bacterium]MDP7661835.1 M23 family metallopeptidase [Nitrospinota bacterium]